MGTKGKKVFLIPKQGEAFRGPGIIHLCLNGFPHPCASIRGSTSRMVGGQRHDRLILNQVSVIITPVRTITPPTTNDHPMGSPKKMKATSAAITG